MKLNLTNKHATIALAGVVVGQELAFLWQYKQMETVAKGFAKDYVRVNRFAQLLVKKIVQEAPQLLEDGEIEKLATSLQFEAMMDDEGLL
jgi:hypothetical protein